MRVRTALIFLLIVAAAGVLVGAAGAFFWLHRPIDLPPPGIEITIAPGSTIRTISNQISGAGVDIPPLLLNLAARIQGRAEKLKAGTYHVNSGMTPLTVLDKMERGDVVQLEVTIPEGVTFEQMRGLLAANPDMKHAGDTLSGAELLKAIGAAEASPEGLFFPDTYRFPRGASDLDILKQAYRAQQKRVAAAWDNRAADLPYKSPYEALILASIVEKETGRAEDRTRIAAVFVNRLRQGKPLQTDPTVIYGMGKRFDGNLRRADLVKDTPFNTYTRRGLPPTPIALPGNASLAAALNPAKTDALYFVARGDGSSEFSSDLDAHNRAVNKYQRNPRP